MKDNIFLYVFCAVLGAIGTGAGIYYHSYTVFEKACADSRKLESTLETLKAKELELSNKEKIIGQLNDKLKRVMELPSFIDYSKLQDEIKSKNVEIERLKQDSTKLQDELISLQKDLDQCQSENKRASQQITKGQSYKRDTSKQYEHEMTETTVGLHRTDYLFHNDIFISIEEVKHDKILGFVGSKGFPSLRFNDIEVGHKLEYKASFYYEIKPIEIYGASGRHPSVKFLITQYKEIKN